MINIFIIGFINNFNLNNYKNNLFVTNSMIFNNDILNSDIIISFCNITKKDYDILIQQKLLKKTIIFHINEPHRNFSKHALELYNNNFFDYIIGGVNTIYKYPKYIIPLLYNNLKEKNDYVKSINIRELLLKNKFLFCSDGEKSLVNKINEKIDIVNFHYFNIILNKNHIFSICSEVNDCISCKISTITLGCAIPIFNGILDSIDEQIFNKNRILFYDSNNIESINSCIEKINELLNDNTKLLNFYKQDIFLPNSRDIINLMINDIKDIFINFEKNKQLSNQEPEPEPVPVVNQEPEPLTNQEPVPVVNQEPVPEPLTNQEPVPVVNQEPVPVVNQEPEPLTNQEPVPVVNQEPVPEPLTNQEPVHVTNQEPVPVVNQEPVPVVNQEPVPVIKKQNNLSKKTLLKLRH